MIKKTYTSHQVEQIIGECRKGYRIQIKQLNDKIKGLESKGKICYICGDKFNLTKHHLHKEKRKLDHSSASSRGHLSIPLCQRCHNKVEYLKNSLERKTKNYRWTTRETDRLVKLRKEGHSYSEISPLMRRSISACQTQMHNIKLHVDNTSMKLKKTHKEVKAK